MKTIRILDLFAGTQSVKKALNNFEGVKFEYIGVDIYSPEEENVILDLSQEDIISKLIKKLPKNWKPDFIWASPVCDKYSTVLTGKGGNFYFIVDKENNSLRPRKKTETNGIQKHMLNKLQNEDNETKALIALKLHQRTKEIIYHYNVPFAIENPTP